MANHRHAEMIKAKADDMDLVVLCKDSYDQANKWQETSQMPFQEEFDYFLCLPKHKDACLHWLNGGHVQHKSSMMAWTDYGVKYDEVLFHKGVSWLDDCYEIRVKPRKEKLWLAVKTDKHEHLGGCRKVRICSHAFVNKQDAVDYLDLDSAQLIEIEVEL